MIGYWLSRVHLISRLPDVDTLVLSPVKPTTTALQGRLPAFSTVTFYDSRLIVQWKLKISSEVPVDG